MKLDIWLSDLRDGFVHAYHASVTAIWATFGDIFFPSKTQAAIATLAREYFYCCFINEFHRASLQLPKGLCHCGGKSRMAQSALLLKGGTTSNRNLR